MADDTAAGRLAVTASVQANCVVGSLQPLDFGTSAARKAAIIDAAAQALTISCTRGAGGISIGLTEGSNAADSQRHLASGQDLVQYEVYTAADHSVVWNLVNTVQYVPASAKPVSVPLYGRAEPSKDAAPGRYSDVLLALVNF